MPEPRPSPSGAKRPVPAPAPVPAPVSPHLSLLVAALILTAFLPLEPSRLKVHLWSAGLLALGLAVAWAGRLGRLVRITGRVGLLFLGWLLLAALGANYHHAALEALLWLGALVVAGLVAAAGGRRGLAAVTSGIALAGLATSLWALAQAAGWLPHSHWANPVRNAGPWTNSNLFAGHLNLALYASVGLLLAAGDRARRLLGLAGFASAVAALALTGSRGGWLAAFAGGTLVAGVLVLGRARFRLLPALALLGAAAVTVLVLWSGGHLDGVRARLAGAGDYSVGHRARIYQDTLRLVRHHPVLGVGPGGYATSFERYRTHADRFGVNFAHSDWLELAATAGLPGLVLALVLSALVARDVARRCSESLLAAGLAAGCLALAVQSLYDFPLRTVATGLEAALALGVLAGRASPRPWPSGLLRLLLVPVLLAGVALSASLALASLLSARAEQARARGDLPLAIERATRAARLSLGRASVSRQLGLLHALNSGPGSRQGLDRARHWYERSLAQDPDSAETYLGLAFVARMQGDDGAAVEHYRAAMEAAPTDTHYHRFAYEYLMERGDREEALRVLAAALGGFPGWATAHRLAQEADALGYDDRALAGLVPSQPAALRRAVPDLILAQRPAVSALLLEREAPRLAENDYVSMIERLASRGRHEEARCLAERANSRWPRSRRLREITPRLEP